MGGSVTPLPHVPSWREEGQFCLYQGGINCITLLFFATQQFQWLMQITLQHCGTHAGSHTLHVTSNIIMNSAEAHLSSECVSIGPSTLFNCKHQCYRQMDCLVTRSSISAKNVHQKQFWTQESNSRQAHVGRSYIDLLISTTTIIIIVWRHSVYI
jgi:hypothetical protein